MKQLLTIAILLLLLSSCHNYYNVKRVSTGQVIEAIDYQDRNFKIGDTVCITSDRYRQYIKNDGELKDTTYSVIQITGSDTSLSHLSTIIGIIQKK